MAVCRYCLKGNLTWQMLKGKWKLFDRSGVHTCNNDQSESLTLEDVDIWSVPEECANKLHEEHLSIMNQCDDNRFRTMILGDFCNDKD